MTTPLWVSLAAAATRLSGATATIAKARIRVSHGISRDGARTKLTDEIVVLVRLRLGKVERLNLRTKLGDLLILVLHTELVELIGDRTSVVVHRLLQIAAALLELEALVRKALSDVVVNALNGLASVAAALRKLTRYVVNSRLSLITKLAQTVGDVAELLEIGVAKLGEALLEAVQLVGNALVVETTLNIANRSARTVATAPAITAKGAASAPAAKEREQDDENPPTVASPAITPAVVATTSDSSNVSNTRSAGSTKHTFSLERSITKCQRNSLLALLRPL